ncbi:MAG: secretin and TonB N-terminal domain-containing protein [Candidatus Omnitrophica bacterium]|nr:secretin and TonB N-terminal domain-containing protein [Candidatus Omnitrophota bacterium]MBU1810177.1 secretin and TonB N-terminal domain-containing protein [Candidatus Omnitrophota bacterium]
MKKISFLFFILTVLALRVSTFSQSTTIKENGGDSPIIEYLEFRGVDIKDVLRQLAKQYDLNIVFSKSVEGPITIQLQNVTIEAALDAIVTINGFVYSKRGNVIRVATPQEAEKFAPLEKEEGGLPVEEVKKEPKQIKHFRLNNADASQLKGILKTFLSSDGSMQVDTRTNSLIINDTFRAITRIEKMLPNLDESTPQVLIETKFIETVLDETEKMGINWTMQVTAQGASRKTTLPFEPGGGGKWMKNVFPSTDPTATDFPDPYGFPYTSSGNFTFGTLDFTQFKMALELLKSRNDTKLISAPRIVTLDKKEAEIHVGDTVPIPLFSRDSDTGRYNITGYQSEEMGVTLTVTPQTNSQGQIRLKLRPKVSNQTGWEGPPEARRPVTSERSAQTEVTIKDGQTIVIGGLVRNETTHSISKVPFLGDIPLLGSLFRHREITPNKKTDLLIFVTAHIVKENKTVEQPVVELAENLRPFKLELRDIKPYRIN